jgi:hypothetical protein
VVVSWSQTRETSTVKHGDGPLGSHQEPFSLREPAGLLAPVSRDSGRRTGNHHRPKRYNRRLRHVF